MILPMVEFSPLYDRLQSAGAFNGRGTTTNPYWHSNDDVVLNGSPAPAKTVIPTFICPSDPSDNWNARLNSTDATYPGVYGKSNYVGAFTAAFYNSAGTKSDRNATFYRNSKVGFRDITDGTSNTLIVAERSTVAPYRGSLWIGWHNLTGSLTASHEFGIRVRINRATNDTDYPINGRIEFASSSSHTGGAQFLMGDGAVHFLNENMDIRLFSGLGTINGAEVISEF